MANETESARIRELQEQLTALQEVNKRLLEEKLREEARHIDHLTASKALRSEFKDKDEFLAAKFADWLLQAGPEYRLVTPANDLGGDVIWMYHEDLGVYQPDGVTWMEQQVREIMGQETKASYYGEVSKHTRVSTYMDPTEFSDDPTLIVLQNGTYSVSSGQLLPHSPLYRAKTRMPVTYDPAADCPTIKAFLQRVASENLAFLQEWVGYHLLKDYRFQRCVVLVGEGDNGKSTFLSLLTCFLGPENVTGQSLYRLSTNRFAPAELQGRLANIAADIGPDELKHTGTIKMLTGGDWITAEKKNRDPFKFLNYAKMSFSCNQLPKTPDETLAFYKRFLVVLFNQTIPKEEQDPQLLEKLTTPEELSGLLNWALEGLARLLEQGCFTEAGSTLERKELYQRMSDPVKGFVSDCVEEDLPSRVMKPDVLSAYLRYCRDRGILPKEGEFWKSFRSQVYVGESQETIDGIRMRIFKGIKLKQYMQPAQPAQPTQGIPLRPLESFSGEQIENPVHPVHPVHGETSEAPAEASEAAEEAAPIPTVGKVVGSGVHGDMASSPKDTNDATDTTSKSFPSSDPSLFKDLKHLVTVLEQMEKETGEAVAVDALCQRSMWQRPHFNKIMGVVMKDGAVFSPRPGYYRRAT